MRLHRGETLEEIANWRGCAASGDIEAMLNIARIAARSTETSAEAEHWLRTASELGDREGMRCLGIMLARRGDMEEAESWLVKSVQNGYVEAMYDLRDFYELQGEGGKARAVEESIPPGQ
jgi:TPR repeat protein